jgi:hypothetical protein
VDVLEVQDLLSNHRVISCRRLRNATNFNTGMCFLGAFANLKLSTKTSFTSRSMEYIGNNLSSV